MSHCPRCLNTFTQDLLSPRVLDCGHTYCFRCLQNNCNTYHLLLYHNHYIGYLKGSFTCEKCDVKYLPEHLTSLPTNLFLLEEIIQEDTSPPLPQKRPISRPKARPQFFSQEVNQPEFVMNQASMYQGSHSQTMNSL